MQTFTLNDLPQRIILDLWNKFTENYKFLYENVSILTRMTSLFTVHQKKAIVSCKFMFNEKRKNMLIKIVYLTSNGVK